MRKILIIQALLCLCLAANAQQTFFDKYENAKGVTIIYISKAMLSMGANLEAGKSDIGRIARKLEYLQILTCERPSMIPAIKEAALDAFRKEGFERIMQIREDGENVMIYQKTRKNKTSEFSLLNVGGDELQVINMVGDVTLKEIKELAPR